jgi:hypothetical protein
MHGGDFLIDGELRLIVCAPDFAEREGEKHGEDGAKLQKHHRADVVVTAAKLEVHMALVEGGRQCRHDASGQYDRKGGEVAHARSRRPGGNASFCDARHGPPQAGPLASLPGVGSAPTVSLRRPR